MSLWEMLGSLMVASLSSFGNGSVMVAVLQRAFVLDAKVLTNDQLLFAFALARVTPGQSNLYIASIGYMMFGWLGAAFSMLAVIIPSYMMLPMLGAYQRLRSISAVPRFIRGLAATAVGVLLATTWNLSKDSLDPPVTWVVLTVALGLMIFTKLPTIVSLGLATALGVAIVLLVPGAAGNVPL